ncbi:MAG: antitoxin [Ilumatobacter sp.]|uniref:antitoxin n=1 Tax=Ilumatobacter sp. TaxID=1967498 RepID=UPI00391BC226
MGILDKFKKTAGEAKDKVDDLVEKNSDKIPDKVEKVYDKVSDAAEKVIPGSDAAEAAEGDEKPADAS